MGGFGSALIRGLTGAASALRAGEADKREFETQALRDALQQQLLEFKVNDFQAQAKRDNIRAQQADALRKEHPEWALR